MASPRVLWLMMGLQGLQVFNLRQFIFDGNLLNEDGTVVPVVHQYDRCPEFKAVVDEKLARNAVVGPRQRSQRGGGG